MATLDDVVEDAKATGEFEGSVEDIIASKITLQEKPVVIATDTSCGAKTELTKITIDRGLSFDTMVHTIVDGDKSTRRESSKGQSDDNLSDNEADTEEVNCKSGFYLSRRKIAGRHLIMFAQRKIEKENDIDSGFIDPLNLMIISRPNTGKNPCEMASQEVRYKYKLLVSSSDLIKHIQSTANGEAVWENMSTNDAASLVRSKWGSTVADRWDEAYDNSKTTEHNSGLAPRISVIGLITGAVLHM